MVTMFSLLKRRDGESLEAFLRWYDGHADAATRIEGLQRYVVSTAVDADQPFDAVSQLSWESPEAMRAALDSPAGSASRADTLAHVSLRQVILTTQRELLLP